jgi:hypothetical protein
MEGPRVKTRGMVWGNLSRTRAQMFIRATGQAKFLLDVLGNHAQYVCMAGAHPGKWERGEGGLDKSRRGAWAKAEKNSCNKGKGTCVAQLQ